MQKRCTAVTDEFRVKIDDREGYSPGYKFNDWEIKGIPIRIEIGEKEMRIGQGGACEEGHRREDRMQVRRCKIKQ